MKLDPDSNETVQDFSIILQELDSFKVLVYALTVFNQRTGKNAGFTLFINDPADGVRVQVTLPDNSSQETYNELMILLQKVQELFDTQKIIQHLQTVPDLPGHAFGNLEIEMESLARGLKTS